MFFEASLYLAVGAGVTMWTSALVGAEAVLAGAPIKTRSRVTLVDVMLAVAPREARQTQARERVYPVHTRSTIKAGARRQNTHKLKLHG